MLIVEGYTIRNYSDSMSDADLFQFCQENPQMRIERDAQQNIIIMALVGGESGYYEKDFMFEVELWIRTHKKGVSFSSSTGFLLPNGAMRSPDACWVSPERWVGVSGSQKDTFLPLVPDFVVEVRSRTDEITRLKAKMEEWLENGVLLGWLVDPLERCAYVYVKGQDLPQMVDFSSKLSGGTVMPGFEFDLAQLKMP